MRSARLAAADLEQIRATRIFANILGALGLVSILAASACGGQSKQRETGIQWHACDEGQCGTLRVPVDYSAPKREQLEIELYRAEAAQGPAEGVLVYLPGGPGVPVIHFAEALRSALGAAFPSLDLVLMDPRGVGRSAPIDCMGSEFLENGSPLNVGFDADDDIETTVERLADFWGDFEERCLEGLGSKRLSNYHSENVARDLDRLRQALGERKLNLWAASYATVKAALYAKMFPEQVGRFVLLLPTFRGQANRIEDLTTIVQAHEAEFERVLDWCADDNRCGLGESGDEVRSGYDGLRASLKRGVTHSGEPVPANSLTLAVSLWLGNGQRNEIARGLSEAARGDWERVLRRASLDPYFQDEEDQLAYWQATTPIQLLDFECPNDYSVDQATRDITEALQRYPHTAEAFALEFASCVSWETKPSEPRIVPENVEAPAMLLVAGAHDPWTPLDGAQKLVDQLDNGSELVVANTEGHGVMNDEEAYDRAVGFIQRGLR